MAAWIEDYNHNRRHSALGKRSPVGYELALAGMDAGLPRGARWAGRFFMVAASPLTPRRLPRSRPGDAPRQGTEPAPPAKA